MKVRITNSLMLSVLLLGMYSLDAKNVNEITKLLHHRAPLHSLELGQIVFYFSRKPIIKQSIKNQLGSKKVVTIVFPATKVTSSVLTMIDTFNQISDTLYRAKVAVNFDQSVSLVMEYNPTKVNMEYVTCKTIDRQESVVFKFFNQEVLDSLHKKQESMLQTAFVTKPKRSGVVIDCGHGGSDVGTIGSSGSLEKDITLEVGLLLADYLHKEGVKVFLTRQSDEPRTLDERTTFANNCNSELLLSIHANHASNPKISGIEIFCINDSLFKLCFSDIERSKEPFIQSITKERNKKSTDLAHCLHTAIFNDLKKKYTKLVDRNIKHEVAQVIYGSHMPAVLVEIGFLSNSDEEKLLNTVAYKKDIARILAQGVMAYRELI